MAPITSSRQPLLVLRRACGLRRSSAHPNTNKYSHRFLPHLHLRSLAVSSLAQQQNTSSAATATFSSSSTSASLSRFLPSIRTPAVQRRAFSSTFPSQFRASSANMVVNAIANRADYDQAINPSARAAEASQLVLIDCYATWCGPCKAIAPKIDEFSQQYSNVAFYKVDVDDVMDVAQELGVRAMPTFIFFKNGEKVDEVLGAVPGAVEAAIKKHSA